MEQIGKRDRSCFFLRFLPFWQSLELKFSNLEPRKKTEKRYVTPKLDRFTPSKGKYGDCTSKRMHTRVKPAFFCSESQPPKLCAYSIDDAYRPSHLSLLVRYYFSAISAQANSKKTKKRPTILMHANIQENTKQRLTEHQANNSGLQRRKSHLSPISRPLGANAEA